MDKPGVLLSLCLYGCSAVAFAGCLLMDPAAIGASAGRLDAGAAVGDGGPEALDEVAAAPNGGPSADASAADDGADLDAAPPDAGQLPFPGTDLALPTEPVIPAPYVVLEATKSSRLGVLSDESTLDTARIQAAIDACPRGQSVLLQSYRGNDAFLTGPLHLGAGANLVVAAGTTLFASRNPRDFDVSSGSCGTSSADANDGCNPLIMVDGADSGIMGEGAIDGRGGEPMMGSAGQTWWDAAHAAMACGRRYSNPTLIEASGAQRLTLYRISLYNSPKFHAVIGSKGLVVWGVTVIAPTAPINSIGTPLTPGYAANTDGLDFAGASYGFVAYSQISVGGAQIGVKGNSRGGVRNMVIAHNHFGAGHGLTIGTETYNGVTDVSVYDLSVDGLVAADGMDPADRSGIRICSDPHVGGRVTGISYRDVCVRGIDHAININASATGATGSSIADFASITVADFHSLAPSTSPLLTLRGYGTSDRLGITLDNVVVEQLPPTSVDAAYASVTLGPGGANFAPSGHAVTVHDSVVKSPEPIPCASKWVSF